MKTLDIALKDLTHSFRSVFAVGMMVVAPLMLTGLIYFAFGGISSGEQNMPAVKVGLLHLDALPSNAQLEVPLGDNIRSMFFDGSVASWITASDYENEASLRRALDDQEIGVAVIVPQDFSTQYLNGKKDVQVVVISDPTLSIGPAVVQNMVTSMLDGVSGAGIALETYLDRQQVNGITPDPARIPAWLEGYTTWYADFQRALFHDPDQAVFVMVAPSAGQTETADPFQKVMGLTLAGQMIFFAFFSGAFAMMSILDESENGTLARLFTTPTDRTAILAGKFLAVFITVIVQGLVLLGTGHYVFGITWGEPAGVVLALTGQVIAATGLGVLLISFVKSSRQGGPVLGGGLTALGMLGGLMTANMPNALPETMNTIANFTPQGWVLKTWQMVMAGNSVADLLVPIAVMLGMGFVMFTLGAIQFKKRFA
jgi:ABC-2 type transport system permease protein